MTKLPVVLAIALPILESLAPPASPSNHVHLFIFPPLAIWGTLPNVTIDVYHCPDYPSRFGGEWIDFHTRMPPVPPLSFFLAFLGVVAFWLGPVSLSLLPPRLSPSYNHCRLLLGHQGRGSRSLLLHLSLVVGHKHMEEEKESRCSGGAWADITGGKWAGDKKCDLGWFFPHK